MGVNRMIRKYREVKKSYEEGLFCPEPGCDGHMEPVQSNIMTQDPRMPMLQCDKCGYMEPLDPNNVPLTFDTYGEWKEYDNSDEAKEVAAARPEVKLVMRAPQQQPEDFGNFLNRG